MQVGRRYDWLWAWLPGLILLPVVLVMVNQNNQSLALMMSNSMDSGSLTTDYLALSAPGEILDQTIHYHTSIYGWFYNSTIVAVFVALRHLGFSPETSFPVFAVVARSVGACYALASLPVFAATLRRCDAGPALAVGGALFLGLTPPFMWVTYTVHPESAGLFFAVSTLLCGRLALDEQFGGWWLAAAWAAAVAAVMCKQTFVPYVTVPALCAIVMIRNRPDKTRQNFTARVGVYALGIAIIVAFLSDPYMLLRPAEFITREALMAETFRSQTVDVATSMRAWASLAWTEVPWFYLSLITAVWTLWRAVAPRDRETFPAICAATLLGGTALMVLKVRFIFGWYYLLPFYPIAIALIVSAAQRLDRTVSAYRTPVRVAAMISASVFIGPTVEKTVANVMADHEFTSSDYPAILHRIEALGRRDWRVIHGPFVPIKSEQFAAAANIWQVPLTPSGIEDWKPDLTIVDYENVSSSGEELAVISRQVGLVPVMTYLANRPSLNGCLGWTQCWSYITELAAGRWPQPPSSPTSAGFTIFARPGLIGDVKAGLR